MSLPYRIVFAGTSDFGEPALHRLAQESDLVAVFTQPDRASGRGRKLQFSPIKQAALNLDLTLYQPDSMRSLEAHEILRSCDADFMVVAAYGQILPQSILDIPRQGCLNIHGSLLPHWRGAAPIQRAIENGDEELGVTIMRMAAGLDTGDMLRSVSFVPSAQETAGSAHDRLSQMGAQALIEVLQSFEAGIVVAAAQDDSQASYAHKLDKREAEIRWNEAVEVIERRVRAFNPWPVAYTHYKGNMLKVWKATAEATAHGYSPGKVLECSEKGVVVAAGGGLLRIEELQLAGKKRVSAADFSNAHSLEGLTLPD